MFLLDLKGFIYTIAVYFYAFRLAFSSLLRCILQQNALRLAPFHLVFCSKTHCVLHHTALHLAAKRSTSSRK